MRNYLARNNMRAMRLGDLGFFYHSNAGKDIVGICEVCALSHQDSTTDDERWDCVDVRAVCEVPKPVTLTDVKNAPDLSEMALVTSMRLSVQPVTAKEWADGVQDGRPQSQIHQATKLNERWARRSTQPMIIAGSSWPTPN